MMKTKWIAFLKKETILCIAGLLAFFSAFVVPPDVRYWEYLNLRVMILLFALMAVMGGFQSMGLFYKGAAYLLRKAKTLRQLSCILVFLCFFSAMLVTNDVALITFIPFTILLLTTAKLEGEMIPLLVLQTIAANLGSMLTPVGNPQNLYLYTISGMSLVSFFKTTLPLTTVSFLLLLFFCLRKKATPLTAGETGISLPYTAKQKASLGILMLLFFLALLAVFDILPYGYLLGAVLLWFGLMERGVLQKLDYSLLLTFLAFFILIGNLGRMEFFRSAIQSLLSGRELWVAFFSSQIISNVPAAVLLSEFTHEWGLLLAGVNIGGLGTLIASMASLITYKFFAQVQSDKKAAYLWAFTKMNLLFALVLLAVQALLQPL